MAQTCRTFQDQSTHIPDRFLTHPNSEAVSSFTSIRGYHHTFQVQVQSKKCPQMAVPCLSLCSHLEHPLCYIMMGAGDARGDQKQGEGGFGQQTS